MHQNKYILIAALILFFSTASTAIHAEQYVDFGDYLVHYNALQSTFLTTDTAREYNIQRSKNRAVLNIAVQQKMPNGANKPVNADVSANAANLTGQLKKITMRHIQEGSAIYYIGEVSVADAETLDFTVHIQPSHDTKPYTIKFRKEFYTR